MLATAEGVLTRPVNAARRRALDLFGRLCNRRRGVIGSIDVVSTDVIEGDQLFPTRDSIQVIVDGQALYQLTSDPGKVEKSTAATGGASGAAPTSRRSPAG